MSIPVLAGPLGDPAPGPLPVTPHELFEKVLLAAIAEGAREPHVMTLSTVDGLGRPDARSVILRDVTEEGWWFSTDTLEEKTGQICANPAVALTVYWPEVGHQVRIRGRARRMAEDVARAGFGRRSEHTRQVLRRRSGEGLPWAVFVVEADEVDFFRPDPGGEHTRVRYTFDGGVWSTRSGVA